VGGPTEQLGLFLGPEQAQHLFGSSTHTKTLNRLGLCTRATANRRRQRRGLRDDDTIVSLLLLQRE
jgi:hypothetical protein